MSRSGVNWITVPQHTDDRGSLSVIDWPGCLPFTPNRFYYLYDVPDAASRAGHAHWTEHELILAMHGSFTVRADDGSASREFRLDRRDRGLLLPPGYWHELFDFSRGAVCAVFASEAYDPKDYCRDYQEFIRIRRQQS